MQEEQLLQSLRQGQQEALRQLFERYYEDLVRRLYRLIPDQSTAEDLVQEVFVRLWEKRAELDIRQSLGAYLHRMAVNRALSYLRKQKTRRESYPKEAPKVGISAQAEQDLAAEELRQKIRRALQDLPARCREVFVLSRYEQLTYRQIAERLDISVKTVENQLSKALKIMRRHLKDYFSLLFLLGFF